MIFDDVDVCLLGLSIEFSCLIYSTRVIFHKYVVAMKTDAYVNKYTFK